MTYNDNKDNENTDETPQIEDISLESRVAYRDEFGDLSDASPDELDYVSRRLQWEMDVLQDHHDITPVKNPVKPVVQEMRSALHYEPEDDQEQILQHQARALDAAFRRLLGDADKTYSTHDGCDIEPIAYAAAFKAQDQYCRTLKTINALKLNKRAQEQDSQT